MTIDSHIPFTLTDWSLVHTERRDGEKGFALWKVQHFGNIRVRMVEYSPGYVADHWCDKGHIVFCVNGEMTTELKDGRKFVLKKGMTYQVGDSSDSHRSSTETGVTLFIVD
ncbi:MAG: DHCW motif cupin fold protein [Ignavibacteriales bacterium]|nr:DHCW motif cupin fold protein [Ignavibacteriales bacterium]